MTPITTIAFALFALAAGTAAGTAGAATPPAHVRNEFEFTVHAPMARVAPLFGANAERSWAAGWNPVFVHPQPAADVAGAVFTIRHDGHEATWLTTVYDPAGGHIQHVYVIPGAMATLIDIHLTSPAPGLTHVAVAYERTALAPEFNTHVISQGDNDRASGAAWGQAIDASLSGDAAAGASPADSELKEGMRAPDFTLVSDRGDTVSLAQFRGKRVVLYFYPKDETPGCTAEACAFRDGLDSLRAENAVVLGVSPDDRDSHQKFVSAQHLNFPLLVDEGGRVSSLYGAWKARTRDGKTWMGNERSTFIIDETGIVRHVWRGVTVQGHDAEVLAALRAEKPVKAN